MPYDYAAMRAADVLALVALPEPPQPDAYIALDHPSRLYRTLLAAGYRWIRTDGDYAIFEKELPDDHRQTPTPPALRRARVPVHHAHPAL